MVRKVFVKKIVKIKFQQNIVQQDYIPLREFRVSLREFHVPSRKSATTFLTAQPAVDPSTTFDAARDTNTTKMICEGEAAEIQLIMATGRNLNGIHHPVYRRIMR